MQLKQQPLTPPQSCPVERRCLGHGAIISRNPKARLGWYYCRNIFLAVYGRAQGTQGDAPSVHRIIGRSSERLKNQRDESDGRTERNQSWNPEHQRQNRNQQKERMMVFWFRKRKSDIELQHKLESVVSVELEHHKKVTDDKIRETKEVTEKFNKIIKENGFTLKIHVAAGGKHK